MRSPSAQQPDVTNFVPDPALRVRVKELRGDVNRLRTLLHTERGQSAACRRRYLNSQAKLTNALEDPEAILSGHTELVPLLQRIKQRLQKVTSQERSVDELEGRLITLEYDLQKAEEASYANWDPLDATDLSSLESKDATQATSTVHAGQEERQNVPESPDKVYFDSVGEIDSTKEALFNYDYDHQRQLDIRQLQYEQGRTPAIPDQHFHRQYERERQLLIRKLLNAKRTAEHARAECIRLNIWLEQPGEPNLLQEALEFQLPGQGGELYTMSEGDSAGLNGPGLLLLSQASTEDRIQQWNKDVMTDDTSAQMEGQDQPISPALDVPATPVSEIGSVLPGSPYSYVLENLEDNDSLRSQGIVTALRENRDETVVGPFDSVMPIESLYSHAATGSLHGSMVHASSESQGSV